MPVPSGIGEAKVRRALAELRALGEINNVPAGRLTGILERAEKDLRERPDDPGPPPPAPAAPLLNP